MNTLIDKSSLPPGNSAFFRLAKLTATQLQVLLPGETNAPGTVSGKTGTPTPQSVGTPTTVTVNAVDANWNIVSLSDTVQLSSSDTRIYFYTGSMSLVNGTVILRCQWFAISNAASNVDCHGHGRGSRHHHPAGRKFAR